MPKMPKVVVAKIPVAAPAKLEKPGAGSTVSKPKSPIHRLGEYAHPPKRKK